MTGIVLAGGKSQRMGRDKGLILWQGKPFVRHIADALAPLCSRVLIVANDAAYQSLVYEVVPDMMPDRGPLAGLYTGLSHSHTAHSFVLSCDVPFVTSALLEYLRGHADGRANASVFSAEGRAMPLVGLYSGDCLPIFRQLLDGGEHRMMRALEAVGAQQIEVPANMAHQLANLNTPNDLAHHDIG